ncbi:hypothetical protein LCGC14_0883430 [marine sediment metagenome]|uniref:Uncharacterized protein n=1 Tax=marine sediment metagenome TaxID=412755 RepID=A0A0F9P648_9ZZZZ
MLLDRQSFDYTCEVNMNYSEYIKHRDYSEMLVSLLLPEIEEDIAKQVVDYVLFLPKSSRNKL